MPKTRLQYDISKLFEKISLQELAEDLTPYLDLGGGGTGDMLKSIYDTDDDGIVDQAASADDPLALKISNNLTDVAAQQTALNNLTNVAAATNEFVLTKDTASGNAIFKASASGGYTDEQAQDAIGTILTDTATIDFTYTDATPSIEASVKAASITEAMQVLADNTTNDVSITKHGYVPKAPNDTTKYLRGDGTWAVVTIAALLTQTIALTTGPANSLGINALTMAAVCAAT